MSRGESKVQSTRTILSMEVLRYFHYIATYAYVLWRGHMRELSCDPLQEHAPGAKDRSLFMGSGGM